MTPSRINRKVPRDLGVVCLKCLEKDPARRYSSAHALVDDLDRFLAGKPISARPASAVERSWLWCRRNPWLAGAVGAIAAALVAVSVFAVLYAKQQSRIAIREKQIADEQKKAANEQRKANAEIKSLANNLMSSLNMSNRNLARLYFERAKSAIERGEIGPGLVRLVQSYRWAVAAGDDGWRHTALASLSAWQRHYAAPVAVFSHADGVRAVAVSPDGRTVLTGSYDTTARLWDASTGQPIGPPLAHRATVSCVAFGPGGKTVLTASWDGTGRLWDASTGQPVGIPLTHQKLVSAVAFSPDGKTVLTGSDDRTARLWDTSTGQLLGPPMTHQDTVYAVAFSPDGKKALTAGNTARLWDVSELPDDPERVATWIVVLGRSSHSKDIPESGDKVRLDILARELVRQAILIAARDEMGLSTRDEVIDDDLVEGAGVQSGGAEVISFIRDDKWHTKVRSVGSDRTDELFSRETPTASGKDLESMRLITAAEVWSALGSHARSANRPGTCGKSQRP